MAPSIPEDGSALDEDYTPSVSFADARRIMTRTDFLDPLDAFQVRLAHVSSHVALTTSRLLPST
jgi:hypothetical protein